MKQIERHQILGADGKTMVYVYDGNVDYRPTETSINYKYYFDKNGKRWKTRPYNQWSSLVSRTKEGSKFRENQPTYKEVSIEDYLLDFDNWCSWANTQPCYMWEDENGRLFQLDKDLLIDGNTIYSRDTVCFIPASLNSLIAHSKSFYTKREMFNKVFTKYFNILDERVIEKFMDMCKMDYTLSKEPRLSVDEWNDIVANREHDLPVISKLTGILQWNDWNEPQQSIVFVNGKYKVSVMYGSKKLVQDIFTDVKEAVLAKLIAKSEKVLELKFEVENFKYYDKNEYLEYLNDMYVKLLGTISKVNNGEIKLKKWVMVDY